MVAILCSIRTDQCAKMSLYVRIFLTSFPKLLVRQYSFRAQESVRQRDTMSQEHELNTHFSSVDVHDGDTSKYSCDKCDIKSVRNPDGTVKLRNPNIAKMPSDYLYHLALGNTCNNLPEMFSNVKFVVCGGTPERMKAFAEHIIKELKINIPAGLTLHDISKVGHRYSLFKVGPVISVNHGMGGPSAGILLHELVKLMAHSGCKDPIFFRMGTCGGIGLPPGTVVVSESCCDPLMNSYYTIPILGKVHHRPALLDKSLVTELLALGDPSDKFKLATGKTMCTDDFYEGQGRLDGAFADHTLDEKMAYLKKIHEQGIVNMEMESTVFAAITHHAGIKAGVVCVTLLNRLEGDQIDSPPEVLGEYQERPMYIIGRYIKKYCEKRNLKYNY